MNQRKFVTFLLLLVKIHLFYQKKVTRSVKLEEVRSKQLKPENVKEKLAFYS